MLMFLGPTRALRLGSSGPRFPPQLHLTILSQWSHQLHPPHLGVPLLPHVAVLHQHLLRPDVRSPRGVRQPFPDVHHHLPLQELQYAERWWLLTIGDAVKMIPVDSSTHPTTSSLVPHMMSSMVSPSMSRRCIKRKFSKLSEPPYLQPLGPSVVLCAKPHTSASSYSTLSCQTLSTTNRSSQAEDSSSPKLILDSPQHPTQRKEKAAG